MLAICSHFKDHCAVFNCHLLCSGRGISETGSEIFCLICFAKFVQQLWYGMSLSQYQGVEPSFKKPMKVVINFPPTPVIIELVIISWSEKFIYLHILSETKVTVDKENELI